jgi:putative transposase
MTRYYHVWFSTKRRQATLQGELADSAHQFIREAAKAASIDIIELALPIDHVHLLLRLNDRQTVAWAANRIKGASARRLFQSLPTLKLDMKSEHLWQRGYGARLVPPDQIETVKGYIKTQFDRPLGRERHHFRERTR